MVPTLALASVRPPTQALLRTAAITMRWRIHVRDTAGGSGADAGNAPLTGTAITNWVVERAPALASTSPSLTTAIRRVCSRTPRKPVPVFATTKTSSWAQTDATVRYRDAIAPLNDSRSDNRSFDPNLRG